MLPTLLTAEAIAETFQVKVSTIKRWARENQIPSVKVGGTVRFDPDEVARFIKQKDAS